MTKSKDHLNWIVKLKDSENYGSWAVDIKVVLIQKELWKVKPKREGQEEEEEQELRFKFRSLKRF